MGAIYAIVHCPSNRKYVGSTANLKKRKKQHFSDLRCGRHFNPYLQRTFAKYGEEQFTFTILEECDDGLLQQKEKEWICRERSDDKKFGFNCTDEPYAPMRGKKHSDATLEKMRAGGRKGEKHPGAKLTEELVRQVIQLDGDGLSGGAIAAQIGVDRSSVSLVLSGRIWKHLGLVSEKPKRPRKIGGQHGI